MTAVAVGVLAYPACVAIAGDLTADARAITVADTAPPEKSKAERDCHKRSPEGQRTPSGKPCPDEGGGERLPQDRRSPLDTLPPLAPLVA